MNLYLLTRTEAHPGYDEAAGFVVVAESHGEARKAASRQAGDEGGLTWLDPQLVTIKLIGVTTNPGYPQGVVLRDFRAG